MRLTYKYKKYATNGNIIEQGNVFNKIKEKFSNIEIELFEQVGYKYNKTKIYLNDK